jgi:hypothetical protein
VSLLSAATGAAARRGAAARSAARLVVMLAVLATLALAAGCGGPAVRFPSEPLSVTPGEAGGEVRGYDTDDNARPDYFNYLDGMGRVTRIGYDTSRDGAADIFVVLDDIRPDDSLHIILILDGIGYEVARQYRQDGGLRLFHPPTPVISSFPAMTDVALNDLFHGVRCLGYEAVYFNHLENRLMGGDADYLSLANEDWVRGIDYRASALTDPLAYLFPGFFLNNELAKIRDIVDRRDRPRVIAYIVSVAAIGTKHLLEGQREALQRVDNLVQHWVRKFRGLVKVTIMSDHGHTLVRGQWVDFAKVLKEKGWNVRDRLDGPKDVASLQYGLITYAAFACHDRAALAASVLEHESVDLVMYPESDGVVVAGAGGRAVVERRGDHYRYRVLEGDPLELAPVIAAARADGRLKMDADGFADDRAWLAATFHHKYPDPLDRVWRAFHGQTIHVPDVIASLKIGYNAGLPSRAVRYPDGASTHGDLEARSATAFIMSMTRPLPADATLRLRELGPVLEDLTGLPWPPARPVKGHEQ